MGAMDAATQERFTRLWTQAQPSIAGYLAALVPDRHQADDLLQEVAVVLLRKFAEYDPARPFPAWAMGVAKTAVLSQRRDKARSACRFAETTIEQLAASWEELLPELDERVRALRDCVGRVSGRARQMLDLRYAEDLSNDAIAERLGLAGGAVRVALHRLRGALQSCIERRLSESEA